MVAAFTVSVVLLEMLFLHLRGVQQPLHTTLLPCRVCSTVGRTRRVQSLDVEDSSNAQTQHRAADCHIVDETYIKKYSARLEAAVASRTTASIPKAAVVATMASGVHCNAHIHYVSCTASQLEVVLSLFCGDCMMLHATEIWNASHLPVRSFPGRNAAHI